MNAMIAPPTSKILWKIEFFKFDKSFGSGYAFEIDFAQNGASYVECPVYGYVNVIDIDEKKNILKPFGVVNTHDFRRGF